MGARTVIRRRQAWSDTDAAGVWHFSTLFRYAEEAEAQLHRELEIGHRTFGSTPRVRVEGEFRAPVRFDDDLAITLQVEEVGGTSVTYGFQVVRDATAVAAGRMVTVLIDQDGRPLRWPDDMAAALRGATGCPP